MPPRIWFSADTHFGHTNIIKHACRPFGSVEEHDRALISNWNEHVGPRDAVYFLGDFAYKNKGAALELRERLHGQIFFIEGNHDDAAHQIRTSFQHYCSVYELKTQHPALGAVRAFLSHYAHRVWNKSHHGAWHLYGHSHNSLPDDPTARSMDVGVDAVAAYLAGKPTGMAHPSLPKEYYRPISIEEVATVMAKKQFVPADHHGRREGCQVAD